MRQKTPAESETVKTEVVCPNDTNPMGILKGGRLVEWMDIAAAVCAQVHAEKICVTAAINSVAFYEAAGPGDVVTISARITRSFNTSMEIFVFALAKNILTGKSDLISEAYFTFVALDNGGKITKAIPVKPVTVSEKQYYEEAMNRKRKAAVIKNTVRELE
ncbi:MULTISPECIES: acyl-CoA thioesterase [Niastella]|uniref:Acyl-CoA thioesterase n=1 Tax=Niastella soli TaxID=2821487 RepID=A0ABS3YXA5_9BACT|nr:acyl-CoA thioesterase [Niastella soli]MBO9202523.1 acyl-CoA thioesterase [Niastella soli]